MSSREEKIAVLESYGWTVGDRNPRLNTAHPGRYMCVEPFEDDELLTEDGSHGPWCIVGDDLDELVDEAYGHLCSIGTVWTREDSEAANAEGWDIFDVDTRGIYQLQRVDEMEIFPDDPSAWKHVYNAGTPLAQKALDFLKENAPLEYNQIVEHCK